MKTGSVLLIILCVLFAVVTVAGVLFRIQHWPFGKEMLYTGISGLVISLLVLATLVVNRSWKRGNGQ